MPYVAGPHRPRRRLPPDGAAGLPGSLLRSEACSAPTTPCRSTGTSSKPDGWADDARTSTTMPAFRAGAAENILLRKNYEALGAFRRDDRPAAPSTCWASPASWSSPPSASATSASTRAAMSISATPPPAPTTA